MAVLPYSPTPDSTRRAGRERRKRRAETGDAPSPLLEVMENTIYSVLITFFVLYGTTPKESGTAKRRDKRGTYTVIPVIRYVLRGMEINFSGNRTPHRKNPMVSRLKI
ncbi:TPA: hypothetical protein G8N93_002727 [Salmonella enterica]|nr:hypothetical protein [Salmonella enterica]